MDELTREFLIESQEGLDRMERCLTYLEERPQVAELIGDIFRSVHTIKGTTGLLGFERLESWPMPARICWACCARAS
jgi:two-component system chemotaxis sensor kinase CheA